MSEQARANETSDASGWDLSFLGAGQTAPAPALPTPGQGVGLGASVGHDIGGPRAGWLPPLSSSIGDAPTHGLNVPVCEEIGHDLGHDAISLGEITEHVDYSVRKVLDVWSGPDAESWQAKWNRQRRRLVEATEAITAMRRRLEIDIDEQRRTSRV